MMTMTMTSRLHPQRDAKPSPPPPSPPQTTRPRPRSRIPPAVFCALSLSLPLKTKAGAPLPNNRILRDRLDSLVLTTTYALNLASRVALLHLLQRHKAEQPLPDLDQPYFQTMLAVMDPETRNHKGKNTIGEAKRVALRTLLDGVPAYLNLAPHLSFSGAKFLANRVAEQLATATKNSVVFRIWGFQRKALRFRLRRALFLQNLGLPTAQKISISGKEMEKLLTDLQLFTRDPGNFKAHGQYGFEAPYSIINNLIQDEFARLPYLQLPSTVPVTRRILKAHWCLFLPYLITLSEECTFWQLWERQRKEIEELYPDLKVTSPLQPQVFFPSAPLQLQPQGHQVGARGLETGSPICQHQVQW